MWKEIDGVRFRTYEYLTEVQTDVTLRRMLAQLSDNDTLYDIGSNVGHVLIPILKKYPTLRVIGFEPSPRNFGRLKRNLELNDITKNFEVNRLALSDEVGKAQFFESSLHGISSFSKEHASSGRAQVKQIDVQLQTLDSLVYDQDYSPPTCIKIDVEGHALRVLRGGKRLLQEYDPSLFIECHGNLDEVKEMLTNWGYKCKEEPRRNAIYATK